MNELNRIPELHIDRLNELLDVSWRIYKSQFIDTRHPTYTEAPFQHHLANIISSVGQLYCCSRHDIFHVDLETKVDGIQGKSKFVDITCEFVGTKASCAIELKFKTEKQAAQNNGRIDAYTDIEALEQLCVNRFSMGRFYMITDSAIYTKESTRGVGTVFATHHGAIISPGKDYSYPQSVGRKEVVTSYFKRHVFDWEYSSGWSFLEMQL